MKKMLGTTKNKILGLLVMLLVFGPGTSAFANPSPTLGKDIYENGNNEINEALLTIVKLVGGIGGTAFTLAILVIALVIIFVSISPAKKGTAWTALISCCAGAFVFYAAYFLAPAIAKIVG